MGHNSTLLRLLLRMPKSPLVKQHRPVQNSIRIQPEIKMAEVKPEVLIPVIVDVCKISTESPYFVGRTLTV